MSELQLNLKKNDLEKANIILNYYTDEIQLLTSNNELSTDTNR